MAIHTDLEVYQLSRDLLRACSTLTRNMPRDYKATLGRRVFNECIEILVLIQRANTARDKIPHLVSILESTSVVEALLRLALDVRPVCLSPKQYAMGADLCTRIGKQVNKWKAWARKNIRESDDATAALHLRKLLQYLDEMEALREASASTTLATAPAA